MHAKKRVPVELSPGAYEKLGETRALAGVSSNAEVLRHALRLYEYLHRQKADGWSVHLVKDDRAKELVF